MTTAHHLNYDEAAAKLNVTRRWLEDRVQRREIPHRRLGRLVRFTQDDLAEITRMYTVPAVSRRGRPIRQNGAA